MSPPAASEQDPFAVLGIEPTLDSARVKRAYFEAVARTPPHRDAETFRRVRAAYEALGRAGGLQTAYLSAPIDLAHELAPLRERYAVALAQARDEVSRQREREQRVTTFVDAASSSTLAVFIARVENR